MALANHKPDELLLIRNVEHALAHRVRIAESNLILLDCPLMLPKEVTFATAVLSTGGLSLWQRLAGLRASA